MIFLVIFLLAAPGFAANESCLIPLEGLTKTKEVSEGWNSRLTKQPLHYRLSRFPNGLRYVTIHDENGNPVFEDKKSSNKKLDLGDGLNLSFTSSIGQETKSIVEKVVKKKFIQGRLGYSVVPFSEKEIKSLTLNYRTEAKGHLVEIKLQYIKGVSQSVEVTEAFNLSKSPGKFEWDRVTFKFNTERDLTEVCALSQGHQPPSFQWRFDEIMAAIKKGSNKEVTYTGSDPYSKILFARVFKLGLENMKVPPLQKIIDKIMFAAINEREVDLKSLED